MKKQLLLGLVLMGLFGGTSALYSKKSWGKNGNYCYKLATNCINQCESSYDYQYGKITADDCFWKCSNVCTGYSQNPDDQIFGTSFLKTRRPKTMPSF